MFNRTRTRYITKEEMNERLKYCKRFRGIHYRLRNEGERLLHKAFIEDKMVEFKLTYKSPDFGPCTFICRKDGAAQAQKISGMDAYTTLSRYYKVPKRKAPFSASPLLYKNDIYEDTRNNAYGYDVNSSYSFAMIKPMPDTSKAPRIGKVEDNEIGFDCNGEILGKGHFSKWVFPLMESPFKKFVERWYKAKKEAKTADEKSKAKGMLNYCIGYLQRINPFLRATIIGYANKMIEDLIDENTLYCNTDSIVSLVPRNDIKIGTELGDFKIEHTGEFAYTGFNYQWNKEISYRGIPKSWFPEDFDILKDVVPQFGNIYVYNKELIRLEEKNNG